MLMRNPTKSCADACYGAPVPKTIQIRDVDDEVYARLAKRAAERGYTVPEFLRREITKLAGEMTMKEWLERTRRGPRSDITREEVRQAFDELRGSWPDVDS